jgi:hypothetical protein
VDRGYAHRIDIVAPVLRKLSVSLRPNKQVKVSILAPTVETISWRCSYYYRDVAICFGYWRLHELTLKTTELQGELPSLHIRANTVCVLSL